MSDSLQNKTLKRVYCLLISFFYTGKVHLGFCVCTWKMKPRRLSQTQTPRGTEQPPWEGGRQRPEGVDVELPLGFQGQYLFSYGRTLASSMKTSSAQESQKFCTHRQLCAYLEVMPALGAAFGGLAGTWPPEAYGSRFRT